MAASVDFRVTSDGVALLKYRAREMGADYAALEGTYLWRVIDGRGTVRAQVAGTVAEETLEGDASDVISAAIPASANTDLIDGEGVAAAYRHQLCEDLGEDGVAVLLEGRYRVSLVSGGENGEGGATDGSAQLVTVLTGTSQVITGFAAPGTTALAAVIVEAQAVVDAGADILAARDEAVEAAEDLSGAVAKTEPLVGYSPRREAAIFGWSASDLDGNVSIGVKVDGSFYARAFDSETLAAVGMTDAEDRLDAVETKTDPLLASFGDRRGGSLFAHVFKDEADNVAAAIDYDGRLYARTLRLGYDNRGIREHGRKYTPLLHDMDGQIALGVDQTGGLYVRKFAAETLLDLGSSGYVAPSEWGAGYDVSFITEYEGFSVAIAREDGQTFPIKKVGATNLAGVLDSTQPIELLTFQGQSNSMNSGTSVEADYLAVPFPHHCLMFSLGWRPPVTNTLVAAESLSDTYPISATEGDQQAPGITCAFAAEGQARLNGYATGGTLTWAAGMGGEPLTTFLPPDHPDADPAMNNWTNLITGAEEAVTVAALYGRTVQLDFHTYIGNEAGYSGLNTAEDYDDWEEGFRTGYLPDTLAALKAATGQTSDVRCLFYQVNMRDTASSPSRSELAALAAGKAEAALGASQTAWLVGPMYCYPVDPDSGDEIHTTCVGRQYLGEVWAWVRRQIKSGMGYTPPWTTSVTRSGAVITATFADTYGAGDLTLDDGSDYEQWIPDTTNHGFRATVDGANASIASVAITGPNVVTVTLSSDPGASVVRLLYGQGGTGMDTDRDGWPTGRGNIFRPTTQPTFFRKEWERGRFTAAAITDAPDAPGKVPPEVRLYACRFDELVS
jgi:hypothetical protein